MRTFRSFVIVCWIGAITAASIAAQSYQAQITGVVRDSTGAVIPNARLKATNIATGVESVAESNDQGIYRFLALPPGQYKVSSNMTGFKGFEQGPITLQVNDAVTLDVTLQVGDASEKVLVTAAAEALQT